jgi:hypothetical protein
MKGRETLSRSNNDLNTTDDNMDWLRARSLSCVTSKLLFLKFLLTVPGQNLCNKSMKKDGLL